MGDFIDPHKYHPWANVAEYVQDACSGCGNKFSREQRDEASYVRERNGWVQRDGKVLCPACAGFDWAIYVADGESPVKAMFWAGKFEGGGAERFERLERGLPDGWRCVIRSEWQMSEVLWLTSGLVDLRVGPQAWVVVDDENRPWVCDHRWLVRRISDAAVAAGESVVSPEPKSVRGDG